MHSCAVPGIPSLPRQHGLRYHRTQPFYGPVPTTGAKTAEHLRESPATAAEGPDAPTVTSLLRRRGLCAARCICFGAQIGRTDVKGETTSMETTHEGAGQGEADARGTWRLKKGLAEMLKGGVIMDVTTPEQAKLAEAAGAVAVMALERVPADVRAEGGVARMADAGIVQRICRAVSIPVMGKVRIGHFVEAQILQVLGVDFIDESEVLTPADERYHIDKQGFTVPFVCGARDLGEALRRIAEGAAMIRTKGEPGTGNVVEAVRHVRAMDEEMRRVRYARDEELVVLSKEWGAPLTLLHEVRSLGRLPVVDFAAGGIATPADAALLMQLGCDGVFVGSGIFKSENPEMRARAIVRATTHFSDASVLAEVSGNLGEPMRGQEMTAVATADRMQDRGR